MDMFDTLSMRRWYPLLLTALAVAIGGCATTIGLGETALRDGRYAEAASQFETALKERPERTDALVGLGIARYGQSGYGEAVALLSKAVGQDPKRADAQLYLALGYLQRGDEDSSAEHLRAFRDLAQSARVTRQVDDALQLLRTERRLSPESRHFIATSLESAVKSEQELQDARWVSVPWPYYGNYGQPFWSW